MTSIPTRDDRLLFFRKFLRHGTRVASVAPSSRALAYQLCRYVDRRRPQIILELGPGSGAVTSIAAEKMHPASTLVAFELDPDFAAITRRRVASAHVVEADAADFPAQLAAQGIERVDVVISGLPMPSMPLDTVRRIVTGVQRFAPHGQFSQLTVMPWVYQPFYQRFFHEVRFVPVWRNLPPGGVYHCRAVLDGWQR